MILYVLYLKYLNPSVRKFLKSWNIWDLWEEIFEDLWEEGKKDGGRTVSGDEPNVMDEEARCVLTFDYDDEP